MEKDRDLFAITKMTEAECRRYVESIRWPDGPVCPHCGSVKSYELKGKSTRDGLRKCGDCREPYTVTMGTPLESSHIALSKWVLAIYLMLQSKKGISAKQLQRMIGGSYKTSWFMCHRIREMMRDDGPVGGPGATVEVDETFVGGKPRKGEKHSRRGRGTDKAPVVVMVEREGAARAKAVQSTDRNELLPAVRRHVRSGSSVMTDEFSGYRGLGQATRSKHRTVCHGRGEFVRGDVHTNTAESFFSLLKRGHYGTFHQFSKKHLQRYADEFAFRWSVRREKIGEQMEATILSGSGRRLTYKKLVA